MRLSFRLVQARFTELFLVVLCCCWLPALPLRAQEELDKIVAIVNDDVILHTELEDRLRTVKSQLQEQGTEMPPSAVLERQVLEDRKSVV